MPRENDFSYLRGSNIRISRSGTIVLPRKIDEVRTTLRLLGILIVPKTALGGWDWWRRCKRARQRQDLGPRTPRENGYNENSSADWK